MRVVRPAHELSVNVVCMLVPEGSQEQLISPRHICFVRQHVVYHEQ